MGCGKTTLGRAAAHAMSMEFIDLDEYIEQECGMTVTEIFKTRGEQGFRLLEREKLREVASKHDVIIATGGGTPCQSGLLDIMKDSGTVVYLRVEEERLHRRLLVARAQRPLIASLGDEELRAFIENNLHKRAPYYNMAHMIFDSSRLETSMEIEATVQEFKKLFE